MNDANPVHNQTMSSQRQSALNSVVNLTPNSLSTPKKKTSKANTNAGSNSMSPRVQRTTNSSTAKNANLKKSTVAISSPKSHNQLFTPLNNYPFKELPKDHEVSEQVHQALLNDQLELPNDTSSTTGDLDNTTQTMSNNSTFRPSSTWNMQTSLINSSSSGTNNSFSNYSRDFGASQQQDPHQHHLGKLSHNTIHQAHSAKKQKLSKSLLHGESGSPRMRKHQSQQAKHVHILAVSSDFHQSIDNPMSALSSPSTPSRRNLSILNNSSSSSSSSSSSKPSLDRTHTLPPLQSSSASKSSSKKTKGKQKAKRLDSEAQKEQWAREIEEFKNRRNPKFEQGDPLASISPVVVNKFLLPVDSISLQETIDRASSTGLRQKQFKLETLYRTATDRIGSNFSPLTTQLSPRHPSVPSPRKRIQMLSESERPISAHFEDPEMESQLEQIIPLVNFDDPETFESRTPQEWLSMPTPAHHVGTPARFFHFNTTFNKWFWDDCDVTDYFPERHMFEIAYHMGTKTMEISRLMLLFDDEDPQVFEARVRHAQALRKGALAAIRSKIFVERHIEASLVADRNPKHEAAIMKLLLDSDPTDGSSDLDADQLSPEDFQFPELMQQLLQETNDDYVNAIKIAIFAYGMLNPLEREKLAPLKLMIPTDSFFRSYVPGQESALCGPELSNPPTEDRIQYLQDNLLRARPIINVLLENINQIWEKIESESREYPGVAAPGFLDDFYQIQSSACEQLRQLLHQVWTPSVFESVESTLNSLYDLKKLKSDLLTDTWIPSLLKTIQLLMSDQLFTLIYRYTKWYASIFELYIIPEAQIQTIRDNEYFGDLLNFHQQIPSQITESLADQIDLNFLGLTKPLFFIKIRPEGNQIVSDPSMDSVRYQVERVFFQILDIGASLPAVNSELFPSFTLEKEQLLSVSDRDPIVLQAQDIVNRALESNAVVVSTLISMYREYSYILTFNVDNHIKSLSPQRRIDIRAVRDEIRHFLRVRTNIMQRTVSHLTYGMFDISLKELQDHLVSVATHVLERIMEMMEGEVKQETDDIHKDCNALYEKITRKPLEIEDLVQKERMLNNISDEVSKVVVRVKQTQEKIDLLQEFNHVLPDEVFNMSLQVRMAPNQLHESVFKEKNRMSIDRNGFMGSLRSEQEQFVDRVAKTLMAVEEFKMESSYDNSQALATQSADLQQKAVQLCADADLFNSREALLGWELTDYTHIRDMQANFHSFYSLWKTAAEFQTVSLEWMDGPFASLDPDAIEADISRWSRECYKLRRIFQRNNQHAPIKVIGSLEEALKDFSQHLPLIFALRNPAVQDRHWSDMAAAVGRPVKPKLKDTLRKIIRPDISGKAKEVETISSAATREWTLEKALDKMVTDWRSVNFEVKSYRNTGTFVLRAVEEIESMLDDHHVKTHTTRSSPFIGPFAQRANKWMDTISLMQKTLKAWVDCQRLWMYLEPIFSNVDIVRQMPNEGSKFQVINRMWKLKMKATLDNPHVLVSLTEADALPRFQDANTQLEKIHRALKQYLNMKRQTFPRFYFLSDEELLEILSESKDPQRIQPFLRKCFDNIGHLEYEEEKHFTAMRSAERERIKFLRPVNPRHYGGLIENWLSAIESSMVKSVHSVIKRSLEAYRGQPRHEWILEWPGQVVICVAQIYWTMEVTEILRKSGYRGLYEYLDQQNDQINEIISLIRGKLNKLHRMTLSVLVTLDVHARDVVRSLIKNKVSSPDDFEWQSQLRYYFESDQVLVRMVNTTVKYGYEYLGNTGRLVITDLTDRCYRTMMGAVQQRLGGSAQGPAGTGKTETTKDMAKAVAKHCLVFNCSDGLNYQSMARFFKGIASGGAWACFDEFNRIDLEVLSVIAQQIMTIQQAISADRQRFVFDDSEITLNQSCAIFITMNPGYSGRTELPDNLKALFRPVSMMIPNYVFIAEISLYSHGFRDARALAEKIVATYRLASEQLSSQRHYDFGMRAVKAVLTCAGNLKRKNPNEHESMLILRAINQVNMPKFLGHDLPLFNGILNDLFPDITPPKVEYGELLEAIRMGCIANEVRAVPTFVDKCVQLYETIDVRHGLVLVGEPFAGKTSCYRVLAEALQVLSESDQERAVDKIVINPKAVDIAHLYGQSDRVSNEWHDGILATAFRNCANNKSDNRQWVIFDGPIDTIWVENMNTTLDDNKKLCLSSGEMIPMHNNMNLIFEVHDLVVASPATVSRCGMVYMEPQDIGWQPMLEVWTSNLSEEMIVHEELIKQLFMWLVPPCLRFVKRACKQVIQTTDMWLVQSLMRLFTCFFAEDTGPDTQVTRNFWSFVEDEEADLERQTKREAELVRKIHGCFIFSLVWSIGATTEMGGRVQFDRLLRDLIRGDSQNPFVRGTSSSSSTLNSADSSEDAYIDDYSNEPVDLLTPLPEEGLVYEYMFDSATGQWMQWMDTIEEFVIPKTAKFHEIIVPTNDTVRYSYLLDLLVQQRQPILFAGPTGTGKSVVVQNHLRNSVDQATFHNLFVQFSGRTTAAQTQFMIEDKLDKRENKGLGPPLNHRCVVFVDDLNMPIREQSGAQPPIELLRQWMDHGGWFNLETNTFTPVVDVQFVAAMGPPGGGRSRVSTRYLRHYNLVYLTETENTNLIKIFSTIFRWFLDQFETIMRVTCKPIVEGTVEIYSTLTEELLPTPAKSHYTFNLRDLSKVFQGMLSVPPGNLTDKKKLYRLWVHECHRVFADRLMDKADRLHFERLLQQVVSARTGIQYQEITATEAGEPRDAVLFFEMEKTATSEPVYQEVESNQKLLQVMEDHLADYNVIHDVPMNLVMFQAAMEHVARILRIIKQPHGHGLLIGVGGSGRQSYSRLAAHIADYEVFQVETTENYGVEEWRNDLKRIMRRAGVDGQQILFLLVDTQFKHDTFLEDVNNILNTGEIPNLFPADEKAEIVETMTGEAQLLDIVITPANVYRHFVSKCRQNVHVIMCMSPVGDSLRNRLRMFPSMVNCCSIDWFDPWPVDALEGVAHHKLQNIDLDTNLQEILERTSNWQKAMEEKMEEKMEGDASGVESSTSNADESESATSKEPESASVSALQPRVVEACVFIHTSAQQVGREFEEELRRHYYTTPTTYLELLSTFERLLSAQRQKALDAQTRYAAGVDRINSTEALVKEMHEELEMLRPVLEQNEAETVQLMEKLEKQQMEADEAKAIVERDEQEAHEEAQKAAVIRDECSANLAEAEPLLAEALESLKNLTKDNITEVRALRNPPPQVKFTMEAVCILMGLKPDRVRTPRGIQNEYWSVSLKLLADQDFRSKLIDYDKENIPPSAIRQVQKYVKHPDFVPAKVGAASKAAKSLCQWVIAMCEYDRAIKVVMPKRAALEHAEEQLETMENNLREKRQSVRVIEAKIGELVKSLDESKARKHELEVEVNKCVTKIERAKILISGLAGERNRWGEAVLKLQSSYTALSGDMLMAAGAISYLGPFTQQFRDRCMQLWMDKLHEQGIPCSESFSLSSVLGDHVEVRQWQLAGLPMDKFCTDNAIIAKYSSFHPLMIDPQGQANKWIREMEKDGNFVILKSSDRKFSRSLENALQFGKTVLLEDVGEYLDPILEPVLLKQTVNKGGQTFIKFGDGEIPFTDTFQLHITTNLDNPNYSPETLLKVSLINFVITLEGLEDQLLGTVVHEERPELEDEMHRMLLQSSVFKNQLVAIEDRILELLAGAKGLILDDEILINALKASREKATEIETKVKQAEEAVSLLEKTRDLYKPLAVQGAVIFFAVTNMSNVDPMYQHSLEWFNTVFHQSMRHCRVRDSHEERLEAMKDIFSYSVYCSVCQSLFSRDQLMFAFQLCVSIMVSQGKIDEQEWKFFLSGSVVVNDEHQISNPGEGWLNESIWQDLLELSKLEYFENFHEDFAKNIDSWKVYHESAMPHTQVLPGKWNAQLSDFQRLLILRFLRRDKLVPAVQLFVARNLGEKYIEPPPFSLPAAYESSSSAIPLVFVLSSGADPTVELQRFATSEGFKRKMDVVSLGEGQGPIAEKLLLRAMEFGLWVLLQNCHLALSWMPVLERYCNNELRSKSVHKNFRLWLTSMPSEKFPVSILKNSIKLVHEPPKGIRNNLKRMYGSRKIAEFEERCVEKEAWKKMLFALSFFHAVIQERRTFGSIGFNNPYSFNASDLQISENHLAMMLNQHARLPFKALRYLTGEINYGGQVIDDMDQRTLNVILKDCYNEQVMEEGYTFSESGVYFAPSEGSLQSYIDYIDTLPIHDEPEVFGLHQNADILRGFGEADRLLEDVMRTQSRVVEAHGNSEEIVEELCESILRRLPEPFDVETARLRYPVKYSDSMNTVLVQELVRYNTLLARVRTSLEQLLDAVKGRSVMSQELEQMAASMVNGKVPLLWSEYCYPTEKALGGFVNDFLERLGHFDRWLKEGAPSVFWISGFFFTQSFLTGVLQNYSRRHKVAIDTISFECRVMDSREPRTFTEGPEDGCYIHGLYLEGARWDFENRWIDESKPKVLHSQMPVLWLVPVVKEEEEEQWSDDEEEKGKEEGKTGSETTFTYLCPVYNTTARSGDLSTTGRSSNYVLSIALASKFAEEKWIRGGVACVGSI